MLLFYEKLNLVNACKKFVLTILNFGYCELVLVRSSRVSNIHDSTYTEFNEDLISDTF